MSNEAPAALQQLGVVRCEHDIPEGKTLHVPGSLVMAFFGEALKQRFVKEQDLNHAQPDVVP